MAKSPETNLEKKQNLKNSPTFISPKFSRTIRFLAILLTAFCSLFYSYLHSPVENQALASLNEAFRLERMIQTRISGLSYAPLANKRGNETKRLDSSALESAKKFAVESLRESETAESLHGLSRIYLAEQEFDKAQTQLEKASEIMPENAEILNDLGVVFLEKSKILTEAEGGKQLELQAKALEKFETAAELKPDFHEAFFNKAICLQTLSLPNQTTEAWQQFLTLDANSKWSEEARQNLELITANKPQNKSADELLQDFMDSFRSRDDEKAFEIVSRNREMITGKLIPQRLIFAFLESEGATKQEYLDALKYIGNLEKQKSGDPFFAEIAEYYSKASKEKFSDLKIAQISIRNGYDLSQKNNYQAAFDNFSKAREIFERQNNLTEIGICDYWLAYLDFQNDKIAASNRRLEILAENCETKSHKWLASQTYLWLSTNARASKEISKSFHFADLALRFAEETFDFYNTQKTFYILADSQTRIKQFPKALANMQKALKMNAEPTSGNRQNWRNYDSAAQLFYALHFYQTAIVFEKEAFELNSTQIKDASFERVSVARLSRIYGSLKKYDKAIIFAEKGRQSAELFKDEANRKKGVAFAFFQLANLKFEQKNYPEALANYDKAIEIYDTMEFSQNQYETRKGRLLCYLAEKNDDIIQREMPKVLRLFDENRNAILEEQYRNSFFNDEQSVYDLAIDYEFKRRHYETAFDYSENSRARSLLDLMNNGGKLLSENDEPEVIFDRNIASKPFPLSEIRARIPEQIQLIQYSILPDKILIWLVKKDEFETFSYQISAEELTEKVRVLIDSIKTKDEVKQIESSRLLYRVLFEQIDIKLDKEKEMVIIPDKFLAHLPFVALTSNKTQNYLVADHNISFAPSASVFLLASENAKKRRFLKEEKFLGIGDPDFDRKEFPDYENLPHAAKEVQTIAELYKEKKVLLNGNATKSNFKKELSKADIIHFAGHYIANTQSSLLSGFLIAGNGKDSKLANYELMEEQIKNSKLIILSACRTGIENYYEGEGMIGAGRTFLALGVPRVVASQWEVETIATAELMETFHYFRKKEKLSTTSALRRAQLEMLNNPEQSFRQPFYWAGFLTLGGYSQF
jgi:CHAT domain-containing protein